MNILSVAEKPSVARELANIIGRGSAVRRNGHSPYNHMTGHMMGLEFDVKYKSWQGVDPEQLFTAEIKKTIPQDKQGIKRTLEEEGRNCTVLLLWLDCDLEGENIAYEVIDIASTYNKHLDIYRAKFSALIPRDIFRTLQQPERPNKHMSDAVDARQEIDLRLGAAFTRFQTMRLQGKFDALKDNVISYGPCQFPTLGFVVERHLKIQNFVPEDFWTISCDLETPDMDERGGVLRTSFHWDRSRLYDRLACLILFEMCVDIGTAVVIESQARPTSRSRPCPLNTIELQKRASRFLRMSSDTTMKVAESLYQRGILSYPRTETDFFKEGFELLPLVEEHRAHADWGAFATRLLDDDLFQWPSQGGHDDQAHPPIHPTRSVPLDSLNDPQEKQLYELVTRHFLACCAPDATGKQTTLRVQMSRCASDVLDGIQEVKVVNINKAGDEDVSWLTDGEIFKATGLMVEERNWLDVYSKWEKWSGNKVAPLRVGEVFRPQNMQMKASHTQPPQALTESDLISEMDRNGIGTDATIAQHITTIQDRTYAFKDEQGRFVPSELGIGLVEGYNVMGYQLNKASLRAAMEKDCQAVARGRMQKEDMVRNCLTQMRECFRICVQEARLLDEALGKYFHEVGNDPASEYALIKRNVSACGICRNGMDLKVQAQENNTARNNRNIPSRFLYCDTCKTAIVVPKKGEFAQCEDLCPICSYQILTVTNLETQKSHTICPKCFGNPPPQYSEPGVSGEFRCFTCSHPTCSHAGRANDKTPFCQCFQPHCDGAFTLRKVDGKGFVASCSKYPDCKASWWLPKSLRSVDMSPTLTCTRCSNTSGSKGQVNKLVVKTIRSLVPPSVPPEDTVCPCCSTFWDEIRHPRLQLPKASTGAVSRVRSAQNTAGPNVGRTTREPAERSRSTYQPSRISTAAVPSNFRVATAGPSRVQNEIPLSSRGSNLNGNLAGGGFPGRHSIQATTAGTTQSRPNPRAVMSSDPPPPLCNCGLSTVRLTVVKEGKNRGRHFFKCPKPSGQQCDFYEFDVIGDGVNCNRSGNDNGRGRGRGSGSGSVGAGTTEWSGRTAQTSNRGGNAYMPSSNALDVVCSRCMTVGHYARSCPNKNL